jgi:pyruvate,water dikinase
MLVWLDDLEPSTAIKVAGSKIGRLAELRRAGVHVPDGFAVTTAAYERFCHDTGLDHLVEERVAAVTDPHDQAALEAAEAEIVAAFKVANMPHALAAEIADAYDELSYRCGDLNVPTAVRSSATGEDSAEASFAGQFDTYLGMSGAPRVLDAVQVCSQLAVSATGWSTG